MVATPEPQIIPSSQNTKTPHRPYSYTYLTNDVCGSWQDGGRNKMLEQGKGAVQEADEVKITIITQELLHSAVAGRVSAEEAGDVVRQMVTSGRADDKPQVQADEPDAIQTVVMDTISLHFEEDPTTPIAPLSHFIVATGIPQALLRLEFDNQLMEKLGLTRGTFARMGIRKQTNVLYRQANFNLMREESEGFAKLMTELFTTSGNEPPTAEVVEDTVEKVKAMIGAFDLDVGRSLDVVLDVFGAVLVKQFRFFVKFLRASPWWPRQDGAVRLSGEGSVSALPQWALPGHHGWHLTDEQKDEVDQTIQFRDEKFWVHAKQQGLSAFYQLGKVAASQQQMEQAAKSDDPEDITSQWIRETSTIPPSGNRDAAQLLGFKLRFYSSSVARNEHDLLPDNLIFLSALLIKIGFISLKDLYPHIWRSDEEMDELRQQKLKEKAERDRATRPGAGARNALLMAGALADDTMPAVPSRLRESNTRAATPSKETESAKTAPQDTIPEPADQKVLLLKSLLAIGALPEALFILGRFPWLMDLCPDLPEYLHRILHHSLGRVYDNLRPMHDRCDLQNPKPTYETDLPGLPKGQVKIVDLPARKVLRWALLDRDDSSDGLDYRFYWDEWNDQIPRCQTVDDVFILSETLLALVGVKIGQDPALTFKLARIAKHSLVTDKSESNRQRWLGLSKRYLLPALSLTKSNAAVVNEVFEVLNNFSINTRYLMYLEWTSGRTSRLPDVKLAFDQAKAETRDILKRISKTNVRPMAKLLAKVAYANPHIVITTALNQIEAYDSIAEVFVEGARYFTDLGYDVLTWAIISSMARAGRSRVKEGGMFASRWLIALSQFAGKIYKRYGMMKPAPVLQYVSQQLDQGNSTDLKMLEHIVASMGGIATDTSYNDSQLQAMGGGPLLQAQTILQLLDRRHELKPTSKRLTRALLEAGLAGKLLLSMAQQRQACIFEEGDVPLKAIGNTFDEIHRVMIQYLELLRSNLTIDEFEAHVPDVVKLLVDYGIQPEVAFWISRSVIARRMFEHDRATTESRKAENAADFKEDNGDVDMSDELNGDEEEGEAIETEDVAEDAPALTDVEVNGTNLDLEATDKAGNTFTSPDDCWHPILRGVMDGIHDKLPSEVVGAVGTGFYVTFWQLSLFDITIPGKSYEDELSRQHKKIAAITADRADVSTTGVRKREAEKRQIQELIDNLLAENKQHLKAFAESKARLQREKDQWFSGKARLSELLNTALMEQCFLPRMLSSPLDAYFCFKFVKFLHGAGTSNFRTLGFYDLFFRPNRLTSLIFTCTSKESDNLGRFLNEILKDLARWHKNKTLYEKEAFGFKRNLPGFAMKVENGKVTHLLDYESFRKILYKWHNNVFQALQQCLTSPEYMHIRNAISILRSVAQVYPTLNFHGTGLQKAVDKLRESDKEDLKVASAALLGALHHREKSWMAPQAFRQGLEKTAEQEQKANPTKEEDVKASSTKEEDGEVDDAVMKGVPSKTERDIPTKPAEIKPASTSRPPSESGRSTPRSAPTNGGVTPARRMDDVQGSERPDVRSARTDTAKSHNLPRRLSPPRRQIPAPSTLPTRPESADLRNGRHDNARMSIRPQTSDTSRSTPDARSSYPRPSRIDERLRPEERSQEAAFNDHERRSRGFDRPDSRAERGARGYGPEQEHDRGRESSRHMERDHVRVKEREATRSTPRERELPLSEEIRRVQDLAPDGPRTRPQPSSGPSQAEATGVNPQRAALIHGAPDGRPNMSIRGQAQESASRSSRPTSPRRDGDRRYPRHDREERLPDGRDVPGRPPMQVSSPTGPSQRPASGNFGREKPPFTPPTDMEHGRLEQDPSHRPPPPRERHADAEPPSGPRSRQPLPRGRPGPPLNTQPPPTSFPERSTPTGPAQHTRNGSYSDHSAQPSAPPTPADGIHPDRLRHMDSSTNEPPRPTQRPPPVQSNPPSGPRGHAPQNAPSGPSPTTRGPPTGPLSNDASGRGGRSGRSAILAINNAMAQGQATQGTSIRGRGSTRQGSGTFPPHMPPPTGHALRQDYTPQQDLFQNPNDVPVQPRPQSTRQDSSRDHPRREDDRRDSSRQSSRREDPRNEREGHRSEREGRDGKDDRGREGEHQRSSRKDEQPRDEQRGYRSGPRDDNNPRKHGREGEAPPYGPSGGRGGNRMANESKRPRRGM